MTDLLRSSALARGTEPGDERAFRSRSGTRSLATELAHVGRDLVTIVSVTDYEDLKVASQYVEEAAWRSNNPLTGLDLYAPRVPSVQLCREVRGPAESEERTCTSIRRSHTAGLSL